MDHREEVAAEAAHVLGGHREDRVGGDRGVGRGPALAQRVDAGIGGQAVDGRDHAPEGPARAGRAGGASHGVTLLAEAASPYYGQTICLADQQRPAESNTPVQHTEGACP